MMKMNRFPLLFLLSFALILSSFTIQAAISTLHDDLQWVVEPSLDYDHVNEFRNGYAIVIKDEQYAVVNTKGEETIPLGTYPYIGTNISYSNSSETYYVVANVSNTDFQNPECRFGIVNAEGETVIPVEYPYSPQVPFSFSDGLALVFNGEKYGYVNEKNELVIPFIYDQAGYFQDGQAFVIIDDKRIKIDAKGTILTEYAVDALRGTIYSSEPYLIARKDNKYGMIDEDGKTIIPFLYDRLHTLKDDRIFAIKNDKWGYLDGAGNVAIPITHSVYEGAMLHDGYGLFINGVAIVQNQNGNWGAVDPNGRIIIPYGIYQRIQPNYNEESTLLSVQRNGKWGFVNTKGDVVVSTVYDDVGSLTHNRAWVRKQSQWWLMNEAGEIISELDIDFGENATRSPQLSYDNLLLIENIKDGKAKFGFVDLDGEEVTPTIYDGALYYGGSYGWLKLGDSWGIFVRDTERDSG